MDDNQKIMDEYLSLNNIKMKPIKVMEHYVDPDIEAWYKANKIEGPINTLKNLKMNERSQILRDKLAVKGAKVLGLDKKSEKQHIKEETEKTNTPEEQKKADKEYLEKQIKLHEEKMLIYKEQRKRDKLVPTDEELIYMIRSQQEITAGRAKYEKEYGSEELSKLINKNFKEEKIEEKKILENHQEKIEKLEKLNEELDDKLSKIEALEYQMEKGQISTDEYNNQKELLQKEKLEVLWDINEMDPAILAQEEKQFEENEKFEDRARGQGFDKEQRKDLTQKNVNISKGIEEIKGNQKGEVNNTKESIEERQEEAIENKELTIEKLKIKLSNTRDEDQIVLLTEEITKLEADKDQSIAQQEMTTGDQEVGYTEIENATTIKGNFIEELDGATIEFKKVIEKQEQLEKEINPEIKQEENSFIRDMQESVVDIENDPNAAKEYLEGIREITEKAKQYNKELEDIKNEPNIK